MEKEKMIKEKETAQAQKPDPALKRLEVLVGGWKMKGRTLDSQEDNMIGEISGEWIAGGFFLQLTGWIRIKDFEVQSVEIIGYDPVKKIFPSNAFGSMQSGPLPYEWDIQGNAVTHSGGGATYRGTINDNGKTITGGWRPNPDTPLSEGSAYDVTMYRVE